MKKNIGVTVLLVLSVFLSPCNNESLYALEKTDEEILVAGNNKFALDLYTRLKKEQGNLFFSPFSISTALAMTYAGAQGDTETQMAKALHFDLDQKLIHPAFLELIKPLNAEMKHLGYDIAIANALWGQSGYEFYEKFVNIAQNYYDAEVEALDFKNDTEGALLTINSWVEKKTKNKIKDLLSPGAIGNMTRLVLTNAIYFKGNWMYQFDKKDTEDELFTLIDGKKVNIPMMDQLADFNYSENELLQILEMPYTGYALSMVVLLPKQADGIKILENALAPAKLKDWLSDLRQQEVDVYFPRFKMTSAFQLNKILESLGMVNAFNVELCDFSRMSPDPTGLVISSVMHKAFVDVNEEGTEAAAATSVTMELASAYTPPPPVFRADHPFIFLIRDARSGSILFFGRVMDPRK